MKIKTFQTEMKFETLQQQQQTLLINIAVWCEFQLTESPILIAGILQAIDMINNYLLLTAAGAGKFFIIYRCRENDTTVNSSHWSTM